MDQPHIVNETLYCIKTSVFLGGTSVHEINLTAQQAVSSLKGYPEDEYTASYAVPMRLKDTDFDYDDRLYSHTNLANLAESEVKDSVPTELFDALKLKYEKLVSWYDTHEGTPCEQIRHQQQVEELEEKIDICIKALGVIHVTTTDNGAYQTADTALKQLSSIKHDTGN